MRESTKKTMQPKTLQSLFILDSFQMFQKNEAHGQGSSTWVTWVTGWAVFSASFGLKFGKAEFRRHCNVGKMIQPSRSKRIEMSKEIQRQTKLTQALQKNQVSVQSSIASESSNHESDSDGENQKTSESLIPSDTSENEDVSDKIDNISE